MQTKLQQLEKNHAALGALIVAKQYDLAKKLILETLQLFDEVQETKKDKEVTP